MSRHARAAAIAVALAAAAISPQAGAQTAAPPVLPRTNPPATITQRIGVTDVTVKYGRPAMKGRAIFGALVPYDQLWRTGADEATTLTADTPFTVNGAAVPAGTYALFTIPSRGTWTVILDRQAAQWGSYSHRAGDEVARVTVTPAALERPVESLTFTFDDVTADAATLHVAWERTRVPIRLGVETVALAVPRLEAALAADGRRPYFQAAMFYFENGLDLEKAAAWMALALEDAPGHIGMLYRQALILEKKGDRAGAIAAARQSLAGAAGEKQELRDEYTRLNTALLARLGVR
ncbi:MAG: DUF2911 domain-containing protein [Vicinamibacterales bacterium]